MAGRYKRDETSKLMATLISQKIKMRMMQSGLSQSDLSRETGFARSTVSLHLGSMKCGFTIETIMKYADALMCEVYDLIPSRREFVEARKKGAR